MRGNELGLLIDRSMPPWHAAAGSIRMNTELSRKHERERPGRATVIGHLLGALKLDMRNG